MLECRWTEKAEVGTAELEEFEMVLIGFLQGTRKVRGSMLEGAISLRSFVCDANAFLSYVYTL
jgi:hypothetical protein